MLKPANAWVRKRIIIPSGGGVLIVASVSAVGGLVKDMEARITKKVEKRIESLETKLGAIVSMLE